MLSFQLTAERVKFFLFPKKMLIFELVRFPYGRHSIFGGRIVPSVCG